MARDYATSRLRAVQRLIAALQTNFATHLAAVQDAGAPLIAPDATAYFLNSDEESRERALTSHAVAVFVQLPPLRTYGGKRTGGAGVYGREVVTDITLELRFQLDPEDDFGELGRTALGLSEVTRWRAERYLGAMLNALEKHARNGDDVKDFDVIAEDTDGGGQPARGLATATLRISQLVNVPQPVPDGA